MALTSTFRRPRGTQDILPETAEKWRALEAIIAVHSSAHGYGELRTPIFEESELYSRTTGASSDIVRKEMYTFHDRGGRLLTLRPEGTPGAARAYLENGLASAPQPVKLWYLGPMFRYDRPQAGRYRQHNQHGIEVFGAASPLADIEVILIAGELFRRLGLSRFSVRLNDIGCPACRPAYRERLTAYFAPLRSGMCEDCRERFERNPLRIFDCKTSGCRALLEGAPVSAEYACADCREHHQRVRMGLETLDLGYVFDPRLVRGLDYYTRTVFEIVRDGSSAGSDGPRGGGAPRGSAQDVLCGGGRYDGLMEELGGPPTPGVGFGLGVERLLAAMESERLAAPPAALVPAAGVFVASAGAGSEVAALRLARDLRRLGFRVLTDLLSRSLKAQFKAADRSGARWLVLVGEAELARGVVALRDLAGGEQREIDMAADKVAEVLAGG